jgi:capsular polysaccharide biosynthesis protein
MDNSSNYPEESTVDLRLYLALLKHWAWLLILAAVITATAAFFYTRTLTPIYSATTTMLVNEAPSTRATDYTAIITSERLALTYAEMMKKRPVVDATCSAWASHRRPSRGPSWSSRCATRSCSPSQLKTAARAGQPR